MVRLGAGAVRCLGKSLLDGAAAVASTCPVCRPDTRHVIVVRSAASCRVWRDVLWGEGATDTRRSRPWGRSMAFCWRISGSIAPFSLSSCSRCAASKDWTRRSLVRMGTGLGDYTASTNLMLRGVQQIRIIMPELHPPKKTLHFQTREYTQDLGCHAAVCMTGDGVECRMGRARHANKKRGDTRAGAAAPPATAKRGTRRASRSAREKACGGCVEPLMELPPTFFWDRGSPSATLSRPFLLGQSLHCLQMVDEWMDSGCISARGPAPDWPVGAPSSSHRARQSMGETWPARGAGP